MVSLCFFFKDTGTTEIHKGGGPLSPHGAPSISAVKGAKMRREPYKSDTLEEEYNYFLSVLFPDRDLKILDYNRVVKDLNQKTTVEFMLELNKYFLIGKAPSSPYQPNKKGEFGMYLNGCWYRLIIKEEFLNDDVVDNLDVSILQTYILDAILDIKDPKTDNRIEFIGGIRGLGILEEKVQNGAACAFSMYPTSMKELFEVADLNKLMPPKSTWFEPKLRSGLFIHDITRGEKS